jgi:hypothetical protein
MAVHPGLTSEVSQPPAGGDSSFSAVDAAADEADGEEWNDRLALAGDDELDALAVRLGGYKPTQASLLAAEEANAAREAARGELGGAVYKSNPVGLIRLKAPGFNP